jgi:hypothetical protein
MSWISFRCWRSWALCPSQARQSQPTPRPWREVPSRDPPRPSSGERPAATERAPTRSAPSSGPCPSRTMSGTEQHRDGISEALPGVRAAEGWPGRPGDGTAAGANVGSARSPSRWGQRLGLRLRGPAWTPRSQQGERSRVNQRSSGSRQPRPVNARHRPGLLGLNVAAARWFRTGPLNHCPSEAPRSRGEWSDRGSR